MSLVNPQTTSASASAAVHKSPTTVDRYPKRKRAEISYAPSEDSEDDWPSDDEYSFQPQKKVKTLPKKLPKHKIFPFM